MRQWLDTKMKLRSRFDALAALSVEYAKEVAIWSDVRRQENIQH